MNAGQKPIDIRKGLAANIHNISKKYIKQLWMLLDVNPFLVQFLVNIFWCLRVQSCCPQTRLAHNGPSRSGPKVAPRARTKTAKVYVAPEEDMAVVGEAINVEPLGG
jgi:hypothetical protein